MSGTSRSGGNRTTSDDNFPQDGMPEPPADFNEELLAIWNSLIDAIPSELLRRVDSFQLPILCECISRVRKLAPVACADVTDEKLWKSYLQTCQHITKLSAMYGLSPIDRRRIRLTPPKERTEIDEWIET